LAGHRGSKVKELVRRVEVEVAAGLPAGGDGSPAMGKQQKKNRCGKVQATAKVVVIGETREDGNG
jgi:hypothetical protein